MSLKRTIAILMSTALFAGMPVWGAWGDNLMCVYRQALRSDPAFKAAESQFFATRQQLPIARSYLFPNISANGLLERDRFHSDSPNIIFFADGTFYNTTKQYQLSVNQYIFNYANWMQIRNAQAVVKQAEATYFAAAQDLMLRVSRAYFAVLEAHDNLVTVQGQKMSLARELRQVKAQFRVGLIAITGVQQIQASYDAISASEIEAKNRLADRLEDLRAITGVYYGSLAGLGKNLPLVIPEPVDMECWVTVASRQNYELLAATFGAQAALENVRVQEAGHLPVVTGTGGYLYQNQSNPYGQGSQILATTSAAVSVTLPLFEGGLVLAETQQASHQYAQASSVREQVLRAVSLQARTAYLGVVSGISKIKADKQAIISSRTSLAATQAGYMVGTSTVVDVLQQQSNLLRAELVYTQDEYAYLISTLDLKKAAGTLGNCDIAIINSWLGKEIYFTMRSIDTSAQVNPGVMTQGRPVADNVVNHVSANDVTPLPHYKHRASYSKKKVKTQTTPKSKKPSSKNQKKAKVKSKVKAKIQPSPAINSH